MESVDDGVAQSAVLRFLRAVWLLPTRRWFGPVILIGFSLSAVFFSVVVYIPHLTGVADGVPFVSKVARVPDEFRHIGNILYYAERPLTAGPFIHNAPPAALWLGDVSRFPSYLYYYVFSFPARAMLALHVPYESMVMILRLLTAATGLACLIVLRRILRALGTAVTVSGWTIAALAITGRFAWQSAGVTYDIPSMLLFLLFVLATVRFLMTASAVQLALMVGYACAVSITKYTFLPFVVVCGVGVLVWVLVSRRRSGAQGVGRRFLAEWATMRIALLSSMLLAAVAFALFVERIVVNLVAYRAADPSCASVYPAADCTAHFDLYRRNENILHQIAGGQVQLPHFEPFTFLGRWIDVYYESLFYYRGPGTTSWHVDGWILVAGALAIVIATVLVVRNLRRLLRTPEARVVAGLAALYTVGVFIFNLHTWLTTDREYAFSGRYLLPVLPFAIAAGLAALRMSWGRLDRRLQTPAAIGSIALLLVVGVTHSSLVSFLASADHSSWFTTPTRDIMMRIANRLRR